MQHRVVGGEGAEERRVGGGVEGGAVVGEVLARDLGEERADAARGEGGRVVRGVVVEGAGWRGEGISGGGGAYLPARKGRRSVSSSYATTPSAHTSLGAP